MTHNITNLPHIARDPIFSTWWNNVYRKDKNVLIMICGETGNCKSGSAITLADMVDRDTKNRPRFHISADPFDPKNQVVTSAKQFINFLNRKHPKGTALIWDEIGVDADNREYFTLKNRLIKKTFQTFRYLNLIVFMTVPDFASVDVGVRKLVHGYIEMSGKVRDGNIARGRYFYTQTSPRTGKIYYKKPRFKEEGQKKVLESYLIPRPRPALEIPYKEMKEKVNRMWREQYIEELNFMKDYAKGSEGVTLDYLKEQILENPEKFMDEKQSKFVPVLIEEALPISSGRAKDIAGLMNMKLKKGEIGVKTA